MRPLRYRHGRSKYIYSHRTCETNQKQLYIDGQACALGRYTPHYHVSPFHEHPKAHLYIFTPPPRTLTPASPSHPSTTHPPSHLVTSTPPYHSIPNTHSAHLHLPHHLPNPNSAPIPNLPQPARSAAAAKTASRKTGRRSDSLCPR